MQKTKTLLKEKNFKAIKAKAFAAPHKYQKAWGKTIHLFFFGGHSSCFVNLTEPQRSAKCHLSGKDLSHIGVIPSSPSQARWWDGKKRVSLRPLGNDLKPWSVVSPDYNHWHSTAGQGRPQSLLGVENRDSVPSFPKPGRRPSSHRAHRGALQTGISSQVQDTAQARACSASWSPRGEETAPTPSLSHRGEEQDKMQNMCIDQGLEEDTVQLGWITAWTLVKKTKTNLLDEEHKGREEIQQWQQEGCLLAIN